MRLSAAHRSFLLCEAARRLPLLTLVAICLTRLSTAAVPTLTTTGDEARSFLGGRRAKMLVTVSEPRDGKSLHVYFLDFSRNPLSLERMTPAAGYPFDKGRSDGEGPNLSPDGTRIAYRSSNNGAIIVRWARGGESEHTQLAEPGYEPRWWVHPSSKDEYVIWVSTSGGGSSTIEGDTYIQKIRKGDIAVDGNAEKLIEGYALRGGRSPDGRFMYTSFPGWAVAEVDPLATSHAFRRFLVKRSRLCNASPYPASVPGITFLAPYHDRLYFDVWWPSEAAVPEGLVYADFTEWSTHHGFMSASWNKEERSVGGPPEDSVFAMIYHVPERKWLKVAKGVRATHLWVERRDQPLSDPVFSVNGEVVNTDGYFAGMFKDSAQISLAGPDGARVLYTLNTDSLPVSQWQPYTEPLVVREATLVYAICTPPAGVSGREASAIRKFMVGKSSWHEGLAFGTPVGDFPKGNKVPVDLDSFDKAFDDAGTHTEFKPISTFVDPDVEPTGTSADVFMGVALKTPRKLVSASIQARTTVANVKVQGSNAAWNTGYETLADAGNADVTQIDLETAGDGAYSYYRFLLPAEDNHKILDAVLRFGDVDSTMLSAPSVLPSGGEFRDSVRVTMESAAPGAQIRYTLDGTTPALASPLYTAPLMIKESRTITAIAVRNDTTSAPTRVVFTKVAARLDPPTLSPGDAVFDDAVTVTIAPPTAQAQVYYTLDGTTPSPAATLYTDPVRIERTTLLKASAFHETMQPSSPVWGLYVSAADRAKGLGVMLHPNGGERFAVGDTVTVRWQTFDQERFNTAVIEVSADDGRNWHGVNLESSIHLQSNGWGNFSWIIPSQLEGTSLVSDACRVRVGQYNADVADMSDGAFTIVGDNSLVNSRRTGHMPRGLAGSHRVRSGRRARRLLTEGARWGVVEVYTLGGRLVGAVHGAKAAVPPLPAEGVFILTVRPETSGSSGR